MEASAEEGEVDVALRLEEVGVCGYELLRGRKDIPSSISVPIRNDTRTKSPFATWVDGLVLMKSWPMTGVKRNVAPGPL